MNFDLRCNPALRIEHRSVEPWEAFLHPWNAPLERRRRPKAGLGS